MNAPLEALASFSDYEGLRKALNVVREQHRDISLEMLDEITGAPRGYFSKLLGPRAAKRVGLQSLGWALGGLGVKCVLVNDPEALTRVQGRFQARDEAHLASVRGGILHIPVKRAFLRKIGAKGGVARWENVSLKKRSKLARKAAQIRASKLTAEQRKQMTQAARRALAAKRRGLAHKKRNLELSSGTRSSG